MKVAVYESLVSCGSEYIKVLSLSPQHIVDDPVGYIDFVEHDL